MAIRYLVPDGNHLPVSGEDGKVDHRLMAAAHAALFSNYRGQPYGGPDKEGAKSRLRKLYEEEGMEWPSEKASEDPRLVFTLADYALGLNGGDPRLPVAITGRWIKTVAEGKQEIKITLADLRSMIANFAKKANGEINVDYDHKSESGSDIAEPIPSAGRITGLMEPEKFTDAQGVERYILWGSYQPTERARQLIAAKEYRYTSPAYGPGIDKATGEHQGVTLSTVALTNRPVIEQMPEVRLSDPAFAMEPQAVHTDTNLSSKQKSKPATAAKEQSMKSFKVKKLADGEHKGKFGVYDADEMVGLAELPDGWGPDDQKDTKEACDKASESARTNLLAEIGAADKAPAEIKALIQRGASVNQEALLLAETVNDKGKIDTAKLDDLLDSGRVRPSASRRVLAAESRVAEAFKAGKIHPKALQRAMRLCLSDEASFQAFIESAKPVVDLQSHGVTTPAEDGQGAAKVQLGELIAKRMKESNESIAVAEMNVIRTKEGLALWEVARQESMEKK